MAVLKLGRLAMHVGGAGVCLGLAAMELCALLAAGLTGLRIRLALTVARASLSLAGTLPSLAGLLTMLSFIHLPAKDSRRTDD